MIDVVMPQMGESIVEGTLTKWLKKAGEHVERDEPLFEISTDKVDTEIPSPTAGTLARSWSRKARPSRSTPWSAAFRMERAAPAAPRQRLPAPLQPPAPGRSAAPPPPPTPAAAPARQRRRAAAAPPSHRWPKKPRAAFAAGPQDGAREQYRSEQGPRHRRGRTHHQAGSGGLSNAQSPSGRAAPPAPAPAPPPPAAPRPATAPRRSVATVQPPVDVPAAAARPANPRRARADARRSAALRASSP